MRLIDADALMADIRQNSASYFADDFAHEWVDKQPTVEERKRGEWIGTEFDGYADGNPVYYEWKCSCCGAIIEDEEPTWNFCPNCGADMRGENNG